MLRSRRGDSAGVAADNKGNSEGEQSGSSQQGCRQGSSAQNAVYDKNALTAPRIEPPTMMEELPRARRPMASLSGAEGDRGAAHGPADEGVAHGTVRSVADGELRAAGDASQ